MVLSYDMMTSKTCDHDSGLLKTLLKKRKSSFDRSAGLEFSISVGVAVKPTLPGVALIISFRPKM